MHQAWTLPFWSIFSERYSETILAYLQASKVLKYSVFITGPFDVAKKIIKTYLITVPLF